MGSGEHGSPADIVPPSAVLIAGLVEIYFCCILYLFFSTGNTKVKPNFQFGQK